MCGQQQVRTRKWINDGGSVCGLRIQLYASCGTLVTLRFAVVEEDMQPFT